jgi:hypothetical protein
VGRKEAGECDKVGNVVGNPNNPVFQKRIINNERKD